MYTIKIKNNKNEFQYFTGVWLHNYCVEFKISPSIKDALIFESRKDVREFLNRFFYDILNYDILIEIYQKERS